jgi:hypothetical protein
MPLDPSISLAAGTGVGAPPNPLKQFGDFLQMQSAVNQQKLFPGQLQEQQFKLQQAQLDQTRNRMGTAIANLAPLAAGDDVTHAKLFSAIGGLKAAGLPTDEIEKDIAANMPEGDGPEFKKWARGFAARALPPGQVPGEVVGSPGTMDNGLSVQPGVVGGRYSANPGGFSNSGSAVQVYPPRSQSAGRVQIGVDASGAPIFGPAASVTPSSLSGLPMGGGGYQVPPALRNPNGPAVPTPPDQQPGAVKTGLGPAETAARTAQGASANAGFDNITHSGIGARAQSAQLANMEADVGNFTTGSGAQKVLDFKRAVQSWAPDLAHSIGIKPEAISAQESFEKIANQIADAQGAGSDARLYVNQAANPHSSLSPDGVKFIIHQLRGNADYLQARQAAASKWPDQANYRGFEDWSRQNLDPRYFQFGRLSPEEKSSYFSGMKSQKDRDAFKTGYLKAQQAGLLDGAPNAGQ